MKKFDFSGFIFWADNSNNSSKKRADRQRRGRSCRIEELEGREMLSVSPWTIANGQFDYGDLPSDQIQTQETLKSLADADVLATTAAKGKVTVAKTHIALNSAYLNIALTKAQYDEMSAAANADTADWYNVMVGDKKVSSVGKDDFIALDSTGIVATAANANTWVAVAEINNAAAGTKYTIVGNDAAMTEVKKNIEADPAKKFTDVKGLKAVKNTKTAAGILTLSTVLLQFNAASMMAETDSVSLKVSSGSKATLKTSTILLTLGADGQWTAAVDSANNQLGLKADDITGIFELSTKNLANGKDLKPTAYLRTITIGGLSASTKYSFEFRSTVAEKESAKAKKTRASTVKYVAVKKLTAQVDDEKVNLTWTAHPNTATIGYEVWMRTKVGKVTKEALVDTVYGKTVASASISISTLQANAMSGFIKDNKDWKPTLLVRAIGEGPDGTVVHSLFTKKAVTVKKTALPAPNEFEAELHGTNKRSKVNLTWTPVDKASQGYEIRISTAGTAGSWTILTAAGNGPRLSAEINTQAANNVTVEGLTAGTTYYFQIIAKATGDYATSTAKPSNPVSVTMDTETPAIPGTPVEENITKDTIVFTFANADLAAVSDVPLTELTLQYKIETGDWTSVSAPGDGLTLAGDTVTARASGLPEADANYEFRLVDAGNADVVIFDRAFKTKEDTPAASPTLVKVEAASITTKLVFTFTTEEHVDYIVQQFKDGAWTNFDAFTGEDAEGTRTITIDSLDASSSHVFRVLALKGKHEPVASTNTVENESGSPYYFMANTVSVYVSPSLQPANIGAGDYGSEQTRMHELADLMVPILAEHGVTVYRSTIGMTLNGAIADSNARDPSIHVALHSNAFNGTVRGAEAFCYAFGTEGHRLAQRLLDAVLTIYDGPNRGVKTNSLAETRNTTAVSTLIEIAFHDNSTDAKWILDNMPLIAKVLAEGILLHLAEEHPDDLK